MQDSAVPTSTQPITQPPGRRPLTAADLINAHTCGYPIDLDRVATLLERTAQLFGGPWDDNASQVVTPEQATAILTGRGLPGEASDAPAPFTATRLVTHRGRYGPWYGVATYRQCRTLAGTRVWDSLGSSGHLSARRANATGLAYGTLHARPVDADVPLPPGVHSAADLPAFRLGRR